MMTSVENLLPDLYEILLKLRYPGIAQANSKDIEESVLGHENRLFLLSWLLAQSSVTGCEEFLTNTDELKLIKWYSNMGICNDPDVLMGKVPIQDQIWALKNLLFFMKNVLAVDQSTGTTNDQSQITDILKKRMGKTINIIPTTCSLTSKLNYTEALQYLKSHRKSLGERQNSLPEATPVRNNELTKKNDESMKKNDESIKKNDETMKKNDESVKTNDESIKKNDESMKKNDESNKVFHSTGNNDSGSQESDREAAVEKFVQVFDSVSNWPNSTTASSTLIMQKLMDNHIGNIHSNMVTLKETLHSKDEVSNFVMMEELKKPEMPLDDIIEDIVIHIEEVSRIDYE